MIITSKQNEKIKLVEKLHTKKGRNDYKKLIIEGCKSLLDCKNFNVQFDFILYTPENAEFVNEFQCEKYQVSAELLKELSSQKTPQGVLAVVEQPAFVNTRPTTNFIVLDGIQDAGNLGTILRTALATQFARVILIDCVDVFSEKVINSSMTAVFKLELTKCKRDEFVKLKNEYGYPLFVADLNGKNALQIKRSCDIIGLVVGNEGNGISSQVKAVADEVITLPMDKNIESLNVAVSAGILMYIFKYNLKGDNR